MNRPQVNYLHREAIHNGNVLKYSFKFQNMK